MEIKNLCKINCDYNINEKIKDCKIVFCGAGDIGYYVLNYVQPIEVAFFVDNSMEKQNTEFFGKMVKAMEEIKENNEYLYVITVTDKYYKEIYFQLRDQMKIDSLNIMSYEIFIQLYLYYKRNIVIWHDLNVSVTQNCTLKCKKCSILTPFLKNKKEPTFKELQEDIDAFFDKVDYLENLGIVGGEAFLCHALSEYLLYLEKYRSRIKNPIMITTNGTIIPDDKTLDIIKDQKIHVVVSDYSRELPWLKGVFEKLLVKLEQCLIDYHVYYPESWVDYQYFQLNKTDSTVKSMTNFFLSCRACHLLKEKKIYYCTNAKFAEQAGFEYDESNELSLLQVKNRVDIIKFENGNIKNGFLKMCRRCNGEININNVYTAIAEQLNNKEIIWKV